ncbi:hypothetical protein C8R43DRAFT_868998, partial [Mycena crocata]
LGDGREIESDVVLGGDGISSTLRTHILGHVHKSIGIGRSCYRAVLDTSELNEIPGLEWLRECAVGPRYAIASVSPYRAVFTYPCRGGALLCSTIPIKTIPVRSYIPCNQVPCTALTLYLGTQTGPRRHLGARCRPCLPSSTPSSSFCSRVLKWQMRTVPVLPTWTRGRAALLGDAAHATMPTLGQGRQMAVEEAGALGVLLPAGTACEDVPARLAAYQELRRELERGEFVRRESLEQAQIPAKCGEYHTSYS